MAEIISENSLKAGKTEMTNTSLTKVHWTVKARPYFIMAPCLLITIGILYPFASAIFIP